MTVKLHLLAALLLSTSWLHGQSCGTGQTLLKNDILAANPTGSNQISVIQGLCEGEAAGAAFNFASVGSAVRVKLASVGYVNVASASGIQAAVDLEFFDGVTFSGANVTLGPSLFRWSTVTNSSIGLVSSGLNVTPDLTQYNIVATSGKLVCAWYMDFNPQGGTCPTGYQTNFATDNSTSFGFTCNPQVTPPQKNLIFITGQGWRDAALATVGGFQLCPIYYAGNWLMRVCVEPVVTAPPFTLSVFGPPNPPPGAFLSVQFSSPSDAGVGYVGAVACANSPGIPYGTGIIPLAFDACLQFLLPDILEQAGAPTNFVTGFTGNLGAGGTAFGTLQIAPQVPAGLGFQIFLAAITGSGKISNGVTITVP